MAGLGIYCFSFYENYLIFGWTQMEPTCEILQHYWKEGEVQKIKS